MSETEFDRNIFLKKLPGVISLSLKEIAMIE